MEKLDAFKAWWSRVRATARSDAIRKKADELRARGYTHQLSFYSLFRDPVDGRVHHKRIEVLFDRKPTRKDALACLETFKVVPIEDYCLAIFDDSIPGPVPAFERRLSFE